MNYTPSLPFPTNPVFHLIQPVTDSTVTSQVLALTTQYYENPSDEEPDDEHVAAQNAGQMAHPRPIIQNPKGRMNKMSDEQLNAIRHEMEQQKPVVDSTQKLPPILPRLPTPPRSTVAPAQVTGASGTQNKDAQASQVASSSTTVDDRADAVDYGSTDDDSAGPSNPFANTVPTPTVPAKVMRRYSTQWLKIWRSHVASEQNLGRFAESNGFGESADKWTAIVSNANVDTKPQALLSEAKIAVT